MVHLRYSLIFVTLQGQDQYYCHFGVRGTRHKVRNSITATSELGAQGTEGTGSPSSTLPDNGQGARPELRPRPLGSQTCQAHRNHVEEHSRIQFPSCSASIKAAVMKALLSFCISSSKPALVLLEAKTTHFSIALILSQDVISSPLN